MTSENFATKYFTETIPLQRIGDGGINISLITKVFKELAGREISAFAPGSRHEKSFASILYLVNTPRKFHRFRNALSRRLPNLVDEVDDHDLAVIAALEACDANVLRLMIENGEAIFIRDKISDELKQQVDRSAKAEKDAFYILTQKENSESFDRYIRAAAKEHWKAAFLGLGTFVSIRKWVTLISDKQQENAIENLRTLLTEIASHGDENYEIVTDTLRELFRTKYDFDKDSSTVCKIIQEVGLTKHAPLITPPLARIVHQRLSQIDAEIRFRVLKVYLGLQGADYAFPAGLFFYLIEEPERGKVASHMHQQQIHDICVTMVESFNLIREGLTLSENCMNYLYRVKWAARFLYIKDPVISAVTFKLKDPAVLDRFVYSLLSLRHPWQPRFSDNHIELINKLIGIDKFKEVVASSDHARLNPQTVITLKDFADKYSQANGDVTSLVTMFD